MSSEQRSFCWTFATKNSVLAARLVNLVWQARTHTVRTYRSWTLIWRGPESSESVLRFSPIPIGLERLGMTNSFKALSPVCGFGGIRSRSQFIESWQASHPHRKNIEEYHHVPLTSLFWQVFCSFFFFNKVVDST